MVCRFSKHAYRLLGLIWTNRVASILAILDWATQERSNAVLRGKAAAEEAEAEEASQ